jgi:hypothetical protein
VERYYRRPGSSKGEKPPSHEGESDYNHHDRGDLDSASPELREMERQHAPVEEPAGKKASHE